MPVPSPVPTPRPPSTPQIHPRRQILVGGSLFYATNCQSELSSNFPSCSSPEGAGRGASALSLRLNYLIMCRIEKCRSPGHPQGLVMTCDPPGQTCVREKPRERRAPPHLRARARPLSAGPRLTSPEHRPASTSLRPPRPRRAQVGRAASRGAPCSQVRPSCSP